MMQYNDSFSSYHPLVNFIYFALVLVFTMCFMHPLCLLISLCSAIAYALRLNGKKGLRFSLRYMLPMLLMAVIINPAFNHQGVTILRYLPSGNPLTLESIFYGFAAAVMLVSVLEWFTCYTVVMSSDKFIWLFGRIIPSLSLILSMALRFIPKFSEQIKTVKEAQCCLGRDTANGTLVRRFRHGVTVFSIVLTWALENAIETGDSMRSRGYGLSGRSAFSIYRFDSRDRMALLWLGFSGAYILCGWVAGAFHFNYYPFISFEPFTAFTATFPLVYLVLCLTPLILDSMEDKTWKRLQSEI